MEFFHKLTKTILGTAEDTALLTHTIKDIASANESSSGDDETSLGERRKARSAGSPGVQRDLGRKRGPGDHEKRLTGDYDVGKDAVSLGVPDPGYDNDWRPPEHFGMARHRPLNTLDQPSAQTGQKSSSGQSYRNGGPSSSFSRAAASSILPTTSSTGSNVYKRRTLSGRWADDALGLGSKGKRQKTGHIGMASEPVDLTEEGDGTFSRPRGKQEKSSQHASVLDVKSSRTSNKAKDDDPFSINESKRNDVNAGLRPSGKNERRARGRLEGSQISRESARPESRTSATPASDHSSGSRETIRILNRESRHFDGADFRPQIPVIDLGNGMDEAGQQAQRKRKGSQGDSADMQRLNETMVQSQSRGHATRSTADPPRGSLHASTNLRSEFRRDAPVEHATPKQTTHDRLRQEQHRRSHRTSSPDALFGEKTIHSPAARNLSSRKSIPGAHSQAPARTAPRARQMTTQTQAHQDSEDVRIAIDAIYSTQCVLQEGQLWLSWSSQHQCFYVECGDEEVLLPYTGEPVTIGSKDVKTWVASKDSTVVWLRGPATSSSNGNILLAFRDAAGMQECHNALLASGSLSSDWTRDSAFMTKVFRHTGAETAKAHEKLVAAAQDRQVNFQTEPGEIMYENDLPDLRSAPSRMLDVHSLSRSIQPSSQKRSKYFDESEMEPTRKSTRTSRASTTKPKSPTPPAKWTEVNHLPKWPSMVYPTLGVRRVTVDQTDLGRLDEGEFLNDNVLSFAMRFIEEHMETEHREKVHFFNTFFYTTLNRKKGKSRLDYQAVERWTKSVDLFQKDYIVVPINIRLHWFVAIICNLPNVRRRPIGSGEEDEANVAFSTPNTGFVQHGIEMIKSPVAGPDAMTAAEKDEIQNISDSESKDRDVFAFAEDGKVTGLTADPDEASISSRPNSRKSGKKGKTAPAPRTYDVTQPTIITLDSFGSAHSTEIRVLKEYITAEAEVKRSMEVNVSELQGVTAKGIPEQPNFCDCGIYVVGYLKEFAKDPDKFVHKILRREMKKEDFDDFDASATRVKIRDDILRLGEEQLQERIMHKKAKKEAKTKPSPATSSQQIPQSSQPVSSALPTFKSFPPEERAAVDRTTPEIKASSPTSKAVPTSSSPAMEVDEDEMEVAAPQPLGVPQPPMAEVPQPRPESRKVRPEDEMLDDPNVMSPGGSEEKPTQARPGSMATSARSTISPLGSIKRDLRALEEIAAARDAQFQQVDAKPAYGHDEAVQREPEIPESQETNIDRTEGRKHIRFDD